MPDIVQDFDSGPCVQRMQPDLYKFPGHLEDGRHKDPLFLIQYVFFKCAVSPKF